VKPIKREPKQRWGAYHRLNEIEQVRMRPRQACRACIQERYGRQQEEATPKLESWQSRSIENGDTRCALSRARACRPSDPGGLRGEVLTKFPRRLGLRSNDAMAQSNEQLLNCRRTTYLSARKGAYERSSGRTRI